MLNDINQTQKAKYPVGYSSILSYLGDGGRRIMSLRLAWQKLGRPDLKNKKYKQKN
jgi:hypothetical protein